MSKYGYLMPSWAIPVKVTPDIDFTNEAAVQREVPALKILL